MHGNSRDEALDRLAAALDRTVTAGPRTNSGFLAALCRAKDFREGNFDTGFIDRHLAELTRPRQGLDAGAVALAAQSLLAQAGARATAAQDPDPDQPPSPWDAMDGFQFHGGRAITLPLLADGEPVVANVRYAGGAAQVTVRGNRPGRRRNSDRGAGCGLRLAQRPADTGDAARSRRR